MKYPVVVMLLLPAVAFAHEDEKLWQAVKQLQARVSQLEQRLEPQVVKPASRHAPGLAHVQYWLTRQSPFDGGRNTAPLRQGMMPLKDSIHLDPKSYGNPSSSLFSAYHDPSRYPLAAVAIDASIGIDKPGSYQLVVKPVPPREVGGAGNVKMKLSITIDGKAVYTQDYSDSLAIRKQAIKLPAGQFPLHLEVVAKSPGFGPSPTRGMVFVGLQGEGDIDARPLGHFVVGGDQ